MQYIRVDMFSNEICSTLRENGVGILLCHPPMANIASNIAAKSIIKSLTEAGITVFPSVQDFWHYDDKIAQKYIFELMDIKCPSTNIFFRASDALTWLEAAKMPLVCKLSAGAGSLNVSILRSRREAVRQVGKMFGRGEVVVSGPMKDWATKVRIHKKNKDLQQVIGRLPRTLRTWWTNRRDIPRERGYIYFQEFIPDNSFDTRITIIGSNAFGFRRHVRPGDFRASGSGSIDYDFRAVDQQCVAAAFNVAEKLASTCLAFDFIFRKGEDMPLLVEMSYVFQAEAVANCPGFWTPDLRWHETPMRPEDTILNHVLNQAS